MVQKRKKGFTGFRIGKNGEGKGPLALGMVFATVPNTKKNARQAHSLCEAYSPGSNLNGPSNKGGGGRQNVAEQSLYSRRFGGWGGGEGVTKQLISRLTGRRVLEESGVGRR